MTGQQVYESMTEKERKDWVKATLKLRGPDRLVKRLQSEHETAADFFASSFPWYRTKQGHDYWEELGNEIESRPKTKYNGNTNTD